MRSFKVLLLTLIFATAATLPSTAGAATREHGVQLFQRQIVLQAPYHGHRRPRAHIAVGRTAMNAAGMAPAVITGTTYYVSPSGSDSNTGTSPEQAWRTVGRVNGTDLRPGDGVLFQGGATFSDNALMPTSGGAHGQPIVFGSYGAGQAQLTQGAWFIRQNWLTFDNLHLGPDAGIQGGNAGGHRVDHIVIQRCIIALRPSDPEVGINSNGDDWTIADNTIRRTGNSGMLLHGDRYQITGNTIVHTGLDPAVTYAKHGIYMNASHALVAGNTISYFQADGVSARYRSSTITGNLITHGAIGIAFFQGDDQPGLSRWSDNTIAATSDAGIYVSDDTGHTMESFVISANHILTRAHDKINLEHTRGLARVFGNQT